MTLLDLAAEIRAIHVERDGATAMVERLRTSRAGIEKERDAARAELAGVAAQRDAHLSRSVELAARCAELEAAWVAIQVELWGNGHRDTSLEGVRSGIQSLRASWDKTIGERNELKAKVTETRERVREACATLCGAVGSNGPESIESFAERAAAHIAELEARLTALTLAPVEVDSFRVGDLVVAYDYAPEPIARFVKDFAHLDKAGLAVGVERLARKPVEVGDTVRHVSGSPARYTVAAFETDGGNQFARTHEGPFIPSKNLVAVAP